MRREAPKKTTWKKIAEWMEAVNGNRDNDDELAELREEVVRPAILYAMMCVCI